jgi:CheY-like chemotaxis protein
MNEPLRVLIIDDSDRDTLLLVRTLRMEGLAELYSERVDTAETMERAMTAGEWDVAISDCHMPGFTVEGALAIW